MSNPMNIPSSSSDQSHHNHTHPNASNPVPIPSSSSHSHSTRTSSVGRSISTRRQSHSQGASGLGRRPSRVTHPPPVPPRALSHDEALEALRGFLKERSSYDVFPVSFRLIVLDTTLRVRKALDVMLLYSVVSAPLWNTQTAKFAGMFTVQDVIHLIQYYYYTSSWEGAAADVEGLRLTSIRDIEKEIKVPPPSLLAIHPLRALYDACRYLIKTHARRLPLIDKDSQTGAEVVISVLTQYRVLKFIATNCRDITQYLTGRVRDRGIGTYVDPQNEKADGNPLYPLATATLKTTVFDVVHMFSERGISAVPIVDGKGKVINIYETVDVIKIVQKGAHTALDLTIAEALKMRSLDFEGVVTCSPNDSLSSIFSLIKIRRVHRLIVIAGKDDPSSGALIGVISLSDIMKAMMGDDKPMPVGGIIAEDGRDGLSDSAIGTPSSQ